MNHYDFSNLEKNLNHISQLQAQNQTAIAELIENSKKTDAQLAETDAQLAKTDAQLAKTDAQLAKTDAQLAKTDAQLEKTTAQLARTDSQLARTDRKLDKISEMYGGVANNLGAVTEEFFVNALNKNPTINGIAFDTIFKQLNARANGIQDEFDIVLLNGIAVFIIEVKYKAHQNDIDCLINKKYQNFATLFPQYSDYKAYLGLATFCINDDLKFKAISQGITILQQQGDIITTTAEV